MSHGVQTKYSSVLTEADELFAYTKCALPMYYYTALEIRVTQSSSYEIFSNTTFSARTYIYEKHFDIFNSTDYSLKQIHQYLCGDNSVMVIDLRVDTRYIFVMTTYSALHKGAFTVLVTGPYNVSLSRLSEYANILSKNKDEKNELDDFVFLRRTPASFLLVLLHRFILIVDEIFSHI